MPTAFAGRSAPSCGHDEANSKGYDEKGEELARVIFLSALHPAPKIFHHDRKTA